MNERVDGGWSQQIEHTLYSYSEAWEGKDERVLDFGDALVRAQPWTGMVMRFSLDPTDVDRRLDALIERITSEVGRCLWITGPGTQPSDLQARLVERGFGVAMEFEGLVLEDLSTEIARNPGVVVEPLSWENATAYATRCTDSPNPLFHGYLLSSAHRYLQLPAREVQIFVARIGEEVAGYAVLRIEPSGIAYFPAGLTVKEFRRRGVYSSLVAHRLSVARAAGCTAAVIGAQTATAAPILVKRGFRPVCHLVALAPPRAE